jgi:hypothetical protein
VFPPSLADNRLKAQKQGKPVSNLHKPRTFFTKGFHKSIRRTNFVIFVGKSSHHFKTRQNNPATTRVQRGAKFKVSHKKKGKKQKEDSRDAQKGIKNEQSSICCTKLMHFGLKQIIAANRTCPSSNRTQ